MKLIAFIKQVYGYIYRRTISRIYVNTNFSTKNTVLLASMGRGGSTLVSEIINYNNRFRVIFEPMKPDKVKRFKHFIEPTYIAPDDKNLDVYNIFKRTLEGDVRTYWTDSQNKKFVCKYRLIKEIRANFMLGWISKNFPEIPLLILVRNPYALAESWSRLNWKADEFRQRILNQAEKLRDVLPSNVLEDFRACEDIRDIIIHIWCMNYYLPFKQLDKKNFCFLYYENFLLAPEKEIQKLFEFLGLTFDGNIDALLKKESSMISKDSPLKRGENILTSWRSKYSDIDIARGNAIIGAYELSDLYDFENTFLPKYDGIEKN